MLIRTLKRTLTTLTTTASPSSSSLWMAAWMKDDTKFSAIWNSTNSKEERRELAFATNEHGWNCLHHACVHNLTNSIEKLMDEDFGQELAATSVRNGWRPLHYASGFGQMAAVDLLLRDGNADLEVLNDKSFACMGSTPFHRAARWWLSPGKPNCIAHLLRIGVIADAKAADGKTAAHIVNPEVHLAFKEILEKHLKTNPEKNGDSVERLRIELDTVISDWAGTGIRN